MDNSWIRSDIFTIRSSREERQFNKELDRALKASVAALPGVADGLEDTCRQHVTETTSAHKQHAEANINRGSTSVMSEHVRTSSINSKEACAERSSKGPQQGSSKGPQQGSSKGPQQGTTGSSSSGDQSSNGDSDPGEPLQEDQENSVKPKRDMLSGGGSITKLVSSKTSEGKEGVASGEEGVTTPSVCAKVATPKLHTASSSSTSAKPAGKHFIGRHGSHHHLALGGKKAHVSAEQLKLKSPAGFSHSVRVGLSRNIPIKPLHPKLKTVSQ